MTVRHIETGKYDLKQGTPANKVGEVVVVAGTAPVDVIEHYVLHTSASSSHPYVWPSETSTATGPVVTTFNRTGAPPSPYTGPGTTSHEYIRCEVTSMELGEPPEPNPTQIDVGWHWVWQSDKKVGEVLVTRDRTDPNTMIEDWYFFTALPSGAPSDMGTYSMSATAGGTYGVEFIDDITTVSGTLTDYTAQHVQARCTKITSTSPFAPIRSSVRGPKRR